MRIIMLFVIAALVTCTSCEKNSEEPFEDTDTMTYVAEVYCTWNSDSPAFPDKDAHFSWMGGATHNANVKFWEVGTLASPGIDLMSITGLTTDLILEVQSEIDKGNAENIISRRHWFCPTGLSHRLCREPIFEFEVSKEFPLVSMVSMLGPSPDWFIGTESLSMVDKNGRFIPAITYELYPYDAGIASDNGVNDCCDREPLSDPQQNVHLITTESGETIGPGIIGRIVFTAKP